MGPLKSHAPIYEQMIRELMEGKYLLADIDWGHAITRLEYGAGGDRGDKLGSLTRFLQMILENLALDGCSLRLCAP